MIKFYFQFLPAVSKDWKENNLKNFTSGGIEVKHFRAVSMDYRFKKKIKRINTWEASKGKDRFHGASV